MQDLRIRLGLLEQYGSAFQKDRVIFLRRAREGKPADLTARKQSSAGCDAAAAAAAHCTAQRPRQPFPLSVVSVSISAAYLSDYAVNDSYSTVFLGFPRIILTTGLLQFRFAHTMRTGNTAESRQH
jgi:hypothetical protein